VAFPCSPTLFELAGTGVLEAGVAGADRPDRGHWRALSRTSPGCQKPVFAAWVRQIRTAAAEELEYTHEPVSCRSEPLWMSVGVTTV
jgi:hypothetical protein